MSACLVSVSVAFANSGLYQTSATSHPQLRREAGFLPLTPSPHVLCVCFTVGSYPHPMKSLEASLDMFFFSVDYQMSPPASYFLFSWESQHPSLFTELCLVVKTVYTDGNDVRSLMEF